MQNNDTSSMTVSCETFKASNVTTEQRAAAALRSLTHNLPGRLFDSIESRIRELDRYRTDQSVKHREEAVAFWREDIRNHIRKPSLFVASSDERARRLEEIDIILDLSTDQRRQLFRPATHPIFPEPANTSLLQTISEVFTCQWICSESESSY